VTPRATFFQRYPLATVIGWGASLLVALLALQGSGVLTGPVAHWVDVAAAVLQVILTAYARQHVTPVVDPKDNEGRPLVPLNPGGRVR
jgi:hypothetical protein